MGHDIQAVLLNGPYDEKIAAEFDMKIVPLHHGITMIHLNADYCDHWSEKLGVSGFVSEHPLLNCKVVHHMVSKIAPGQMFAVIETDYIGGRGSQAAAVYRGGEEIMPPEATEVAPVARSAGPINKALRLLGVQATPGRDEFQVVGLHRHRDGDDLFEAYRGEE
jgi:hypothetical protein